LSAGLLLALLLAGAQDYEALVAEGVASGKAGRLAEAAECFDRAVLLDPSRPEALVERGGLRFVEGRYDEAARDLEAALRLRDDDYARDLRASALHLAGRPEQALAEWNRLGRPTLRTLTIGGLERTRDRVARREVGLREGELLRLVDVRRSQRQLDESGAFDRAVIRPVPLAGGRADVEVALVERHGIARGWLDFAVSSGVAALQGRAPVRYANLGGTGVSVGAEYRWQENRPQASAAIAWPRPLGLGAYLRAEGFRGDQLYDVEGETLAHRRGFDAGLRRVLGADTTGEIGFHLVNRRFDGRNPLAADGRISGLRARIERRLVERDRFRLDAGVGGLGAAAFLGSDFEFARALARVKARLSFSGADRGPLERSALAAQLSVAVASAETPFDEAFAPGASPEMELPLRGRRQADEGILGRTPLARRLLIGNLEWRRCWLDSGALRAGTVLFYDGAGLDSVPGGTGESFHDVGFGLRLAIAGASLVRIDVGHGLTDGRTTLSGGLGHSF
jgi:hypothetical protein